MADQTISHYRLLEKLGEGGMGVVYKAVDLHLDRTVAIKFLSQALGSNEELLARFKREARLTANLNHINIVTVYELAVAPEGGLFLVMEYIEGTTLAQLIASGRPSSLRDKLNVVIDVCAGLSHAHKLGIVHRDIKPSNVMVTRDGTVKIVDFGIAQMASAANANITRTGVMLGSVSYMSPEQIVGKEMDGRSDIFSLGNVLYEVLTGHRPFEGDGDFETLTKIVRDNAPPLSHYLQQYPPQLDAIVQKALAKEPDERYSTADDLAADLGKLLGETGPLREAIRVHASSTKIPPRGSSLPVTDPSNITGPAPYPTVVHPTPPPPSEANRSATIIARPIDSQALELDAQIASDNQPTGPSVASDFTQFFTPEPPPGPHAPNQPQVRLTFTASNDRLQVGRSVLIMSVPFRIGRSRASDMVIVDSHISEQHAVIHWDGLTFSIVDRGSTNGTYVNGRKVKDAPQTLPYGAVIRLGTGTVLSFSSDEIFELPDLVGQTVADRYRLTKVLRNGSKTALYQADDSHLPQQVAIKILSPSLAGYPGYLEHFNREAETAVRLRHPHICQVLDYGQARIRIGQSTFMVNYLSMELMEGGSLADHVGKQDKIEVAKVVMWLDDITRALESAHRQGVVHGGLKLSSIVFDREGEPYVTDFAMANRVDDHASTLFIGSPEFLAPEEWEGAAPTPAADQYSLAVITYILLAGSPPFEGQIDPKVRERNFLRGPIPLHEEAARTGRAPVPPRASEVVKRALAVKPEDRYPSVRDFSLALRNAISNPSSRLSGKPNIFISYQRDPSSGWAVYFASELNQKYHISAFVDTQRMDSVVRFPVRLKKAIQDCDVFVCLLTGTTLQSKWVQEEIRLAWEHNKPMVPVFQESYAQPDPAERLEEHIETLINYDGVKLLDRQNLYVENAIQKLAEMVKTLLPES